jgi:hypothetical protein
VFKRTAVIVNTTMKVPTKLFFHSLQHTCYCELLWQYFPLVPLKLQLYKLGSNNQVLHVPPQEEVARKFSGLEEHSCTLHHTPTQHLCIHYSKINAPFSQNFSLNHRINTQTPAFCGRIKLTENEESLQYLE